MHLLIQQTNDVITSVTLCHIIAHQQVTLPVNIDHARAAAFLADHAGETMPMADYECATMTYEKRLLVLTAAGDLFTLPADTLMLNTAKLSHTLLLDFMQHWRTHKYAIVDKTIAPRPDWQAPTITLAHPAITGTGFASGGPLQGSLWDGTGPHPEGTPNPVPVSEAHLIEEVRSNSETQ